MKITAQIIIVILLILFPSSCSILKKGNVQATPTVEQTTSSKTIVVWLEDQYLANGDSFLKKTKIFQGKSRKTVRQEVMSALKAISNQSFNSIKHQLLTLEKAGQIKDIRQHWIINGFSANVTEQGYTSLYYQALQSSCIKTIHISQQPILFPPLDLLVRKSSLRLLVHAFPFPQTLLPSSQKIH